MPFTPFHFGPHALIGLPLRRFVDLPVFLAANVVVDVEPLLVMTMKLDYPLHGYAHTLLFASVLGVLLASAVYPVRGVIAWGMHVLRLPYQPTFGKMALAGVLGAWLHVLFDAVLYRDIRPFFPLEANPLQGLLSHEALYGFCMLCFVPAILLWISSVMREQRRSHESPVTASLSRTREEEG